jgi:cell division protein FtsQ
MIEKVLPSGHLKNQRQALRNRRRSRVGQSLGRFLVVSGLAGGLAWGMASPYWTLTRAEQVEVKGTRLMSVESIRSFLGLSYPLSLWEVPTYQLQEKLETNPAIATARIDRQLFPPRMRVEIRERKPVASVRSLRGEGFLDEAGILIPKRYYERSSAKQQSLPLEVIGYSEQYRVPWRELYPLIRGLPVKVWVIDWRDPSNLVLKTDLGKVYLGAYNDRLLEKLTALIQSRQLSSKIPLGQILYIDLSDPDAPTIQLKPKPSPPLVKPIPNPR